MKATGCILIIFLFGMWSLATCDHEANEIHDSTSTSEKKTRLISFNNDHGEVKIELDFAVPFMTIPVKPKSLGGQGEVMDPLLEINTKGLLTVGSILFFLITFVPKLVKLFVPQAHSSVADGIMPLMSRIDEALHTMNIPSKECYQRSACWVGTNSFINPSYLHTFSMPEWLKTTLDNPEIQEALKRGQNGEDCSIYKCSIPLQSMSTLVNIGKGMFSSEN